MHVSGNLTSFPHIRVNECILEDLINNVKYTQNTFFFFFSNVRVNIKCYSCCFTRFLYFCVKIHVFGIAISFPHKRAFSLHFGILISNNVKNTKKYKWLEMFFSRYRVLFMCFTILVTKKLKKKVSSNVFVSLYQVLCLHFGIFLHKLKKSRYICFW